VTRHLGPDSRQSDATSRSLAAARDELVTYDALPGITPTDAAQQATTRPTNPQSEPESGHAARRSCARDAGRLAVRVGGGSSRDSGFEKVGKQTSAHCRPIRPIRVVSGARRVEPQRSATG